MSDRKEGPYWIKYDGGHGWELAEYTFGAWYLTGSDIGLYEVEEVGLGFGIRIIDAVRIHPPTGGE